MAEKQTKPLESDVEAEFSRLFWAARNEHRRLEEKETSNGPNHKSALAFAKAHGLRWAEALLEASRLNQGETQDKTLELLTECEHSVPARWHSLIHFVKGTAFLHKKESGEAIKAFRKVLEDPKFEMRG